MMSAYQMACSLILGKIHVSDAVRKIGMEMELILPNTDYTTVAKLMQGEVKIGTIRVDYFEFINKVFDYLLTFEIIEIH